MAETVGISLRLMLEVTIYHKITEKWPKSVREKLERLKQRSEYPYGSRTASVGVTTM